MEKRRRMQEFWADLIETVTRVIVAIIATILEALF